MLTDVEKAIVRLKMITDMFNDLRGGHNCAAIHMDVLDQRALYTAIKALKEQRPHGEWIKFTLEGGFLSSHKCSNCGFNGNQLWHFCPSCGASMRVKDKLNRVSKELNSEIEKSKSEIVPDYRDGWRLREGEAK